MRKPILLAGWTLLAAAVALAGDGAAPQDGNRTQFDVTKAPWPQVHGPYGNCSAPELGLKLVDDLAKAKLAWQSEATVPGSSPGPVGKNNPDFERSRWGGEYCTPIVADGKVFLSFWRVSGRQDWKVAKEDQPHWRAGRNPINVKSGIGRDDMTSDDIMLCVDAQTGKTVWQTVAGKGALLEGYKLGEHMACCWWDDKVFFAGSSASIYGLDVKTGAVLWTVKGNSKGAGRGAASHTPVVSGGVVCCNSMGYDPQTGKALWSKPAGDNCFAIPWLHEGVPYFIVGGTLIEARTGKVMWRIPEVGLACGTSVWGDMLVSPFTAPPGQKGKGSGSADDEEEKKPAKWQVGGMAAYRISPKKFEKMWQLPKGHNQGKQYSVAVIRRGLAIGDLLKTSGVQCGGVAVDLLTGKEVVRCDNRLEIGYFPAAAENRMFSNSGYSFVMSDISPQNFGKALGKMQQAEVTGAAYANGFLYLRQVRAKDNPDYCLACYDLRAE